MASKKDFVKFDKVDKSYDGKILVVKDLQLDIEEGEFVTMLGPSGSGKTTCLMMLAGFETPTNGEIYLDGNAISSIPPHKRGIGMVFQNYALFPHMTVYENLAFPLRVRKIPKDEADKKIDTMKKTIEALQAGIDATKPGNRVDDVAQAFWKILDKYGIEKKSRTGYSIGIGYPPDWGEHTLNIYKGDMTLLEPNVCFHMIAVMQFGDWGVEASEAIRVTDTGAELFCNFPKELHVKS